MQDDAYHPLPLPGQASNESPRLLSSAQRNVGFDFAPRYTSSWSPKLSRSIPLDHDTVVSKKSTSLRTVPAVRYCEAT